MSDLIQTLRMPQVSPREVEQLAQSWVNEPQMQAVAMRIARECHVPPGEPFNNFRRELAVLAAEQYLQGRLIGRGGIITIPTLPKPKEKMDVTKPYEVGDSRWKPPTMRQD